MKFEEVRAENIVKVVRYQTTMRSWDSDNKNEHIIGVQLNGDATHTFAHDEFIIRENCIYFLNQKDNYHVELNTLEHTEAFSFHFTSPVPIETDSFCIQLSDSTKFESILQKAETAYKSGDEFTMLSLFYQLCAEFVRIREKTQSPHDRRAIAAKNYMDLYFQEKDCLEQAVVQSQISERHFNNIFRDTFHITPGSYITSKKIEHAKNLLSIDGLHLAGIAEACGFSDVYYFCKVFKKETGTTPGKWRQMK